MEQVNTLFFSWILNRTLKRLTKVHLYTFSQGITMSTSTKGSSGNKETLLMKKISINSNSQGSFHLSIGSL